jgi:hypothetical protein
VPAQPVARLPLPTRPQRLRPAPHLDLLGARPPVQPAPKGQVGELREAPPGPSCSYHPPRSAPSNKPLQLTAAGFCHLGGFVRAQHGSLHARPQLSGQPLGGGSCRESFAACTSNRQPAGSEGTSRGSEVMNHVREGGCQCGNPCSAVARLGGGPDSWNASRWASQTARGNHQ